MKKTITLMLAVIVSLCGYAQKTDLANKETPITWLGIDVSNLKFIGDAAQWKDAGQITNEAIRDKYAKGWNDLFVAEKSKYDVAGAVHRGAVNYATEVTDNANKKITNPDFLSKNTTDVHSLVEVTITSIVSKYDFMSKTGIGLMMFAESMSKEDAKASMWVVFVDMGSKKVLLAKRLEEKASGFGFRNYWAKTFYNALDDIKDNFDKWKIQTK